MNSFSLALFNVKNNIKLFNFNIFSMIFAIAVFFNFFSLIFNPSLGLSGSDRLMINATLYMTSMLLIFFTAFFVLYSNSFFLKQRKKEIGIYTFMGVDNSKTAVVFAIEQIILGLISLSAGLFFGVIFQKAFLMLLTKAAGLRMSVEFYLSIKAVIITSIAFILIFVVAAIKGFMNISSSRLVDLINSEKHEDKVTRTRYFTGIVSIFMIAVGHYYSRHIFNDAFLINGGVVFLCMVAGTFLLFSSFLSVVIKFLVNNKRILYRGTNIISISNISYRVRLNYKTLACIAIIAATTLTAIETAISIQYLFRSTVKITHPYSFTYVGDDRAVKEKFLNTIKDSRHRILLDIEIRYLVFTDQGNGIKKEYPVIRYSDFVRIQSKLGEDDRNEILDAGKVIGNGIGISVSSTNDSGFDRSYMLDMYGLKVRIKKTIDAPLLGARFENNAIVLWDSNYIRFKENCNKSAVPQGEHIFNGIRVSNQDDSINLYNKLSSIPEIKNNLNSYISYYNSYNELTGIVKFTGLFLGLVFMLSTGCIMYMKIISDAIGDKKEYEILMKLGMDRGEIYGAVSKQVGLSYVLPLMVGGAYAFMAISVLQGFLNKYIKISLMEPFVISLGIYSLVYSGFYFLTTRKFLIMVTKG